MTYDVRIFGDLLFEEKSVRAWKRSSVTSAGSRAIAAAFPKRRNQPAERVATILSELPRIGFFQLEELDGLVRVRGQFHEIAFQKRARQLAAIFMAAGNYGAQGTVSFLGEGVWLGFEIFLDHGRAKLCEMNADAVRRAAHDPALDIISGHFQAAAPSSADSSAVLSESDSGGSSISSRDLGELLRAGRSDADA